MHHDIGIFFLLLSLLLPRTTLLLWWPFGHLPFHTTGFFTNAISTVFVPRILILVWIYNLQGFSGWFWIHLVVMLLVWRKFSVIVFRMRPVKKKKFRG